MLFNRLFTSRVVWRIFIGMLFVFFLPGCAAEAEEAAATPAEVAAVTEIPTDTPQPTAEPTDTAVPTNTAEPTDTPEPTNTPAPTNTPGRPTLTPTIDKSAVSADDATEKETPAPSGDGITDVPTNALEVITLSESAAEVAETIFLNQFVEVLVSGAFTQTITQNCFVEQGDIISSYCQTAVTVTSAGADPVEEQNEIVMIGEQIWMRSGDEVEWEEMPPDFIEQAGFSEDIGQMKLSEFMTDAAIIGETVIEDEPVYEIAFELDVEAYFATILGEEMATMFAELSEEMSGGGKLWIGQKDSYPRKADVEMIFLIEGEEMVTSTQAAYSYNEPVRIPDPTQ